MGNERLRRQMLWFVAVFVIVGIVGIYIRNAHIQKTGARQGFFSNQSDSKTEYYDDGNIKAQGPIKDNYIKDGEWTYFREDGNIEAKEMYKDGRVVEVKEVK